MERQTDMPLSENQQQRSAAFFLLQMTDVRLIEIKAEVCEPAEKEESPLSITLELPVPMTPELDDIRLRLRFRTEQMPAGDESFNLSVVLEGTFEPVVDPKIISRDALQGFIRRNAISILWPYLSETVHSITSRMGLSMTPF